MSQYSGFKKVSDDREKAVMRHPNGHTITIAKRALSRAHLSELERLPLYQADPQSPVGESADDTSMKASEGGHQTIINVGVPQTQPAPTVPAPAPNNMLNAERKQAGVMPQQDTPADVAAATKNTTAQPQGNQPATTPQPQSNQTPTPAQPAGNPEPGLPGAPAVAPIQLSPGDQFVDQMRKWSQDLAIHPQTYRQLLWYQHNPDGSPVLDKSGQPVEKGFFGKLGTVFGLLMGGIGSGLAHQPNMMMQLMDEQIKNNLAAQEKSKQNELNFGTLLDQHLTNQVAAKKGQADINHLALTDAVTRNQFRLSAARRATVQRLYDDIVSKYPEGSDGWNRGMQALGQLSSTIDAQDQAAAPMINSRFQYYKSLMGTQPQGEGVQPGEVDMDRLNQLEKQSLLKAPGALPQGEIDQMDKEADDVRNVQQLKKDFLATFDQLEGMHLKGALSPKVRAAETDALLARASKVGEGRYTEASNKSYHSLLPDKLDGPGTGPIKRKAAESFFDDLIGKKTSLERHNIWHPTGQTGQEGGGEIRYDKKGQAWRKGPDGKPMRVHGK